MHLIAKTKVFILQALSRPRASYRASQVILMKRQVGIHPSKGVLEKSHCSIVVWDDTAWFSDDLQTSLSLCGLYHDMGAWYKGTFLAPTLLSHNPSGKDRNVSASYPNASTHFGRIVLEKQICCILKSNLIAWL
jgi:hypothetical protein